MSWLTELASAPLTLPTIVLAGATAVWAGWNLKDLPVRTVRTRRRALPDRDPISRTFYAYRAGQLSRVVDQAIDRVERASSRRFGRSARKLPWTRWGAERLSPGHGDLVRRLRRLHGRLEGMRFVAIRREAGIWVRLDFWRSRALLRARFHAELAESLSAVARIPPRWTAP